MSYDVVIIGAGSMGMAAGYYLSKANKSVALIDKYDPPHSEASHHGESRLIRHAYGEGENYVPLALRSQELWQAMEKQAGTSVFLQTGVLNIGTEKSLFLKNVIQSAKTFSLPAVVLTSQQINERWPGYSLPGNLMGCFEKNSGILMSEKAINSFRKLAVRDGAEIYPNSKIQLIEANDNKVKVNLNDQVIEGNQLIITAGKGTNQVTAHLERKLPITPVRKTFSWFHSDENLYSPEVFPAWSFNDENSTYYGFPSLNHSGVKIGRHDGGHELRPNEKLEVFGTYSEDSEVTSSFAEKYFSQKAQHKEGKVCTYTNSPDGDFIIDRLPGYQNIMVACGFSGHGFKFSSAIGEVLSQMVLKNKPDIDISNFGLSRF
ncbi:sarcosine oxidase [Lentibacillus halodurans]|uniref:Sarcosine oxidase n=1 Tax=Lentibacillus halodurans TaxID=237679 RepID=A0A1I0XM43_9BACI|nr:N-methyl-L-tryptophan oxidase [Lentibacillus halodurans]SFB02115.1 sarcosine oxidase [Lentibacillus halodurans]